MKRSGFLPKLYLSLFFIVLILIAVITTTYLSIRKKMENQIHRILEMRASLFQEELISIIDRAATGCEMLISILDPEMEISYYRSKALSLLRSTTGCRNIIIYTGDSIIKTIRLPKTPGDEKDWWEKEIDNTKLYPLKRNIETKYSYQIIAPFYDGMETNIILPVVISILQGGNLVGTAYVELRITQILQEYSITGGFDDKIGNYRMEYSLLSPDWNLYETTRNRSSRKQPVYVDPEWDQDTGIDFLSSREFRWVEDYFSKILFLVDIDRRVITDTAKFVAINMLVIGLATNGILLFIGMLLIRQLKITQNLREREIEARYQVLQLRMNPHFLFNTINQLISFVEDQKTGEILDSLKSLSHILHIMLRDRKELIPLRDELLFIRNYLRLQKILYGDRFTFQQEIDSQLLDCKVIKLCLQPLIENSFIHGMAGNSFRIHLRAKRDQDMLVLEVADNGRGVNQETASQLKSHLNYHYAFQPDLQHIGIMSIQRRIKLLCGEPFGIELAEVPRGFQLNIYLPLIP